MILDNNTMGPETSEALAALDRSEHVFYLAGSRYMGCARPDSDWDFYTQEAPGVIAFLRDNGFVAMAPETDDEYMEDNYTRVIMQKREEGHTVQVQVLSDVQLLRRVRNVIRDNLLEEHIKAGKVARNYLWRNLANLLAFKAKQGIDF